MIGYAIGNGPSREKYDFGNLNGNGLVVGCNTIFKDFTPDYIVALDRKPTAAIEALEDRQFRFIWRDRATNKMFCDDDYLCLHSELNGPFGMNSGIVACCFLAKFLECRTVRMIGFDNLHYGFEPMIMKYSETQFIKESARSGKQ